MAISVPELAGPLRVPRPAHPAREWATARNHYRVRMGLNIAHISDNLLDLLLLVDGRHTVAEIAEELERRQHRPVHPAEVAYLLRERLVAAGLIRLRRGHPALATAQPPAYAAPTVPLVAETPPASELAAPAASPVAAAAVQAPVPQPVVPSRPTLDEPIADVAPAGLARPAPEPVPPAASPPQEPDTVDPEETLDLVELCAAFPSAIVPEDVPEDVSESAAAYPRQEPELSPFAVVTPPDDEPTLVLPREEAHPLPVPASDHASDEVAGNASRPPAVTLASATSSTTRHPSAAALAMNTTLGRRLGVDDRPARARRRVRSGAAVRAPSNAVTLLLGSALLALVVAAALRSHPFGANIALQPTPTLVPTATPAPPRERILPGETAYDVLPSDTLSTIAARTHINVTALTLVNADVLGSSGTLTRGMRLAIPAIYQPAVPATQQPRPLYYTVRHGDTLYDLGQLFGTDWDTIASYNNITDQYSLTVGQGIIIPAQP